MRSLFNVIPAALPPPACGSSWPPILISPVTRSSISPLPAAPMPTLKPAGTLFHLPRPLRDLFRSSRCCARVLRTVGSARDSTRSAVSPSNIPFVDGHLGLAIREFGSLDPLGSAPAGSIRVSELRTPGRAATWRGLFIGQALSAARSELAHVRPRDRERRSATRTVRRDVRVRSAVPGVGGSIASLPQPADESADIHGNAAADAPSRNGVSVNGTVKRHYTKQQLKLE